MVASHRIGFYFLGRESWLEGGIGRKKGKPKRWTEKSNSGATWQVAPNYI